MIQISPTILNSFQALHDPDSPWMTDEKFRAQLLSPFAPSEPADAGNAVHEAAFDHGLVLGSAEERLTVTNKDGNSWLVDGALLGAIREACPDFGSGIPEVPFLLTEDDLEIEGVQCSGRADYLSRPRSYELKTSGRIKAGRYVESAQRLAYLVRYCVPLTMILAQVKITNPRGRPKDIKGLVTLEHCTAYPIDPDPTDLGRLQSLIRNCLTYLRTDAAMIDHVQSKKPPVLL